MRLYSGAPSDTGSPAAGQNPPDKRDVGTESFFFGVPIKCSTERGCELSVSEQGAYFCRSRDGSNLGVEVSALREILHYHGAGVMQQGLLMNRVLHLWNLLQICHLEAFRLDMRTH